jgi:uncharacterized protein DUF6362
MLSNSTSAGTSGLSFRSGCSVARARRVPNKRLEHNRSKEFLNVVAALEWASEKLLALPATSPKPKEYSVAWPTFALDPNEAFGYTELRSRAATPTAFEIEAMDKILAWLSLISDPRYRRAVALRSLIHPVRQRHVLTWTHIGRIMGAAPLSTQRWYTKGISALVAKLCPNSVAAILCALDLRSAAARDFEGYAR